MSWDAICINLPHTTIMVDLYADRGVVRGHHAYKETWTTFIVQKLATDLEDNPYDQDTVATYVY